jgi:hypothetical protein
MDQSELAGLYEQYLGRAPDESGIATWSGQDYNTVLAGITGSQEYANRSGGGDGGGGFGGGGFGGGGGGQDINQIYQQYLGRDVDPSGAATFAGMAPQDIINAIQGSPEYANYTAGGGNLPGNAGGTNLNALYQQYLGRDVDPAGAATWAGRSMDEIVAGITGSQEYAGRGGFPAGTPSTLDYSSMTPEQIVSDVYRKVLGREADAGAAGWIEDVRGGTTALELAQRLQASNEGKAYLAANPEESYKVMAGLSQQNAPFKREGDQFGYYTPITDNEGNEVGKQFNPTMDFSGFKYSGARTTPVGESSTATTHQYEDNKGGTITVDDRGNMISYTPSTQWYAEQQAKHPNAIRQGYRNINYLAAGPLDQTINIMGKEVPVEAQEFMTNDQGQLVVDKSGNLIPMVYEPSRKSGFQNFIDQAVDLGIMTVGTLGGGPIGAAGAAGFIGLKNETPTNQILKNAALAAGTTWLGGRLFPTEVAPLANTAGTVANTAATVAPTVAGTVASQTPAWLLAAQKGAVIGGTMGTINAVAQGQDPLKGAAYGALTGGVGGGAGSYFGGQISPFAGNVLGGAVAGTAGAAVTGQDLLKGALYGGGSGALDYGLTLSDYAPDVFRDNPYLRGAVSGAAFSSLAGGDPIRGALSGAAGSYIGNELNTMGTDFYNRTFNQPSPDRFPVTEGEWNAPDARINLAPRADIDFPTDIRFADNAPISMEEVRGTAPSSQLSRLASYGSADELPLPDFEDTFPVNPFEGIQRPQGIYVAGDVIQSRANPDSTLTVNDDLSVTVRTPEGEFIVPESDAYNVLRAVEQANRVDYSQGDVFIPEPYGGEYSKYAGAVQPIPPDMAGFEAPSMINPLVNIGNKGAFADDPFMKNVVDREGTVTVEMSSPDISSDIKPFELNQEELKMLDDRDAAFNLGAAGPMSQPSEPQEALMISESAVVEANATPREQRIIDQLKNIITSPDTSPEQKQVAASELKQISIEIATQSSEFGEEIGALSGVTGGSQGGVEGGVTGGVDGGVLGGVIGGVLGGRGIQPGTAGGYYGEDPNPGLDKEDMPDEESFEETVLEPTPNVPSEEFIEDEDEESARKRNQRRQQPQPRRLASQYQIPGYSFNQNISGALPSNLTATMLAGAPTQEGRRMLQQLRQLYPQLSTIDPQLLQTLSSRAGAGSGGGALSAPAPGYPEQAAGRTTFAQSGMPANFNALSASGLQALGGASNPNIAGYAEGGDVHIPEFKTGTTGHYVQGRGDGQSDEIPAMLANGEYVFDADTVAALGNGSNEAGAKALDKMREAIRKHKRSAPHTKIPPKAKSPLEYLKGK